MDKQTHPKRLSVKIATRLYNQLKIRAQKERRNISTLIDWAVENYLKENIKND